jgi:hypothetical protein
MKGGAVGVKRENSDTEIGALMLLKANAVPLEKVIVGIFYQVAVSEEAREVCMVDVMWSYPAIPVIFIYYGIVANVHRIFVCVEVAQVDRVIVHYIRVSSVKNGQFGDLVFCFSGYLRDFIGVFFMKNVDTLKYSGIGRAIVAISFKSSRRKNAELIYLTVRIFAECVENGFIPLGKASRMLCNFGRCGLCES